MQMTPQREAEIQLVPYDLSWRREFELERNRLAGLCHEFICGPIEHIGSTAVPGLLAKPIIDLMMPVADLESSRPAIKLLKRSGYVYADYRSDVMHWFCKPSLQARTHHLHLVPFESPLWNERLTFRDYIRKHPQYATTYANLKRKLAKEFRFDREAYTEAKGPFVKYIVGLASEEQESNRGKQRSGRCR